MKKLLNLLIFIPLILMLLLMMPVDFAISSWHLWKASASVEGRVISSGSTQYKSNYLHKVAYEYRIHGQTYQGSRISAGWLHDGAFPNDEATFLAGLRPGSMVTVHYDPSSPDFSLLTYGWFKWGLGFSLVVWGLLAGSYVTSRQTHKPRSFLAFAITRSMTFLGFIIIALLPTIIPPAYFSMLGMIFCGLIVLTYAYGRWRYRDKSV